MGRAVSPSCIEQPAIDFAGHSIRRLPESIPKPRSVGEVTIAMFGNAKLRVVAERSAGARVQDAIILLSGRVVTGSVMN